MPAIALDPSQAAIDPFADLLPAAPNQQELIGGENGAQAFQRDQAGNLRSVPMAFPTGIAEQASVFTDLIPPARRLPAVAFQPRDETPFADLIPEPVAPETAKAFEETATTGEVAKAEIRAEPSYLDIISEALNPQSSHKALTDLKDRLLFSLTQKPNVAEEATAKRAQEGGFPVYYPEITPADITAGTPGAVLTRWAKRGVGELSDMLHGFVTPENAALGLATVGLSTTASAGWKAAGLVVNRLIAAGFSADAAKSAVMAEMEAQNLPAHSPEREAAHFKAATALGMAALLGAGAAMHGEAGTEAPTRAEPTISGEAQQPTGGEPNAVPVETSVGLGAHAGRDEGAGRPVESPGVGERQSAVQEAAGQGGAETQAVQAEPVGNDWTQATAEPDLVSQRRADVGLPETRAQKEIHGQVLREWNPELETFEHARERHFAANAGDLRSRVVDSLRKLGVDPAKTDLPDPDQFVSMEDYYSAMRDAEAKMRSSGARLAAETASEWSKEPVSDQSTAHIAPAAPEPRRLRATASDGGFSDDPLISFVMNDMGGILSKSTALRKWGKAKFEANKSLWDDAPHFSDPRHNKIYDAKSGQTPDAVATAAADAGLLPEGATPSDLYREIIKRSESACSTLKAEREQARLEKESNKKGDEWTAAQEGADFPRAGETGQAPPVEDVWMNPADDPNYDPSLEKHGQKLKLKANKEGGFVDLDGLRSFGARLYERGITFAEWASEMVRHLGTKVKEHLQTVWDAVKSKGDERGGVFGKAGQAFGLNIKGKRTHLDAATAARSAKLQKSFADAERAQREISEAVPSERRRNAISVWREAGGDVTLLRAQASNAKQTWFRRAAEDAQMLTPEEMAVGNKVGQTFGVLESRGNKYGVLSGHRDNYVPHVWDVAKKFTGIGSSKLQDKFKFNKARSFDDFAAGDQAGFKPKTLDIGKLLPAYLHEMNKVIADRQFVQDVSSGLASDQRPLVIPRGNAKMVENEEYVVSPVPKFHKAVYDTMAEAQAALQPGQTVTKRQNTSAIVNPRGFAPLGKDAAGNPIQLEQRDYTQQTNQPALSGWRWVASDTKGNTAILKSDLATHPELTKRLNSMMGQSAIRQWYNEPSTGISVIPKAIAKGLDTAQAVMKREMFGLLAPFHQVQEGTHAVGHMVNPTFGLEDMSRTTSEHMDAMRHGLMLMPEKMSGAGYIEGVGGKNTFLSQIARKYGGPAGRLMANTIDGYQNYLFHQYIPALKFKTWQHALERNLSRYDKQLKSGEVTEGDVKMLTAEQVNAAYGHLNLALLDRNPTMQHILQLGLLAPDFLEARARFAGQAVKGLASKSGVEQFRAIAVLAAAQAGISFVISNLLGDEWDPTHPFEVTHNGRTYSLRTVPEDLFRLLFSGPDVRREFVSARINPVAQKIDQLRTGRNYRGEKTTALQTLEELFANYIPITARQIPGIRELTETSRNAPTSPLEQLAGSMGLKISRYSPITKTYQMAHEWAKAQGLPVSTGVYEVSKYQQLRYALEDGDMEKAGTELQKLRDSGMARAKIRDGFHESVNHPFTGTLAGDKKFRSSLDEAGRAQYDLALQKRRDILRRLSFVR